MIDLHVCFPQIWCSLAPISSPPKNGPAFFLLIHRQLNLAFPISLKFGTVCIMGRRSPWNG